MLNPGAWPGRRVMCAALLGIPGVCAAGPAAEQHLQWGYVEYGHTDVRLQPDKTGHGESVQLSLPLTGPWFASAGATRLDSRYDDPAIPEERVEDFRAGLGFHSTDVGQQAFAALSYVHQARHFPSANPAWERLDGGFLSVGERWGVNSRLTLQAEGGLAYLRGDWGYLDAFARVTAAARLVSNFWVVGGYSTSTFLADAHGWSAGVRLTFGNSPTHRPGARVAGADPTSDAEPDRPWQPGQALVAMRSLLLQQRPLAGAAEIAKIPAGTTMTLEKSTENDFGTWWYVSAGTQEGWIRESWLK